MNRKLIAAISIASANAICTSTGLATLTIDLRATGTSSGVIIDSKNVYFTGVAGGTVSFDLYAIVTGNNTFNLDEWLLSCSGSFLTTGNLHGELLATRDPLFNGNGGSDGMQQDLDSDGDLDVGSNNDASSTNFYSTRWRIDPPLPLPGGPDILFGTLTWTFTGGSADAMVSFRKRSSSSSGSWLEDNFQITSNDWFNGTPVTIYTPEPAAMLSGFAALGLLARKGRHR